MASLKDTKTLFFTTSPRSPEKIKPEIELLTTNFSGYQWNSKTQVSFMDLLARVDFFEGNGYPKDKAFSARDRINRAPKSLGLVDLSPKISLTEAGQVFVYGKRPHEIFLRQLLKFQLPSPYHTHPKNSSSKFLIKPYLEIMRLIYALGSLSFDEIKIFGLKLTHYDKFDEIKNEIINFRKQKQQLQNGNYKKFVNDVWTNQLKHIFRNEISNGNTKTRESNDDSINNFIKTKKSNARDYVDACFRYLRFTQLVSIKHTSRTISFCKDKLEEVEFILENVDRKPIFVADKEKYKKYLGNPSIPKLYTDNQSNILKSILKFKKHKKDELSHKSIEDLKDILQDLTYQNKEAIIKGEIQKLKSYSLYEEIIVAFNHIMSNDYYDAPLMLEYNIWRAMTMINGGLISGNFKTDDEGQPLSTAIGNMPDIECDYGDFCLSVEVTMQSGQRQYETEGEPVARHYGQMKKRVGKESYCLFIAPKINPATLAHFFALNKMDISYYGGKSKIIPLELSLFIELLKKSYEFKNQPTPKNIQGFLDEIILGVSKSNNEIDWNQLIKKSVLGWLT